MEDALGSLDLDVGVHDARGACQRPERLVFAVTEGVTYQATPKEIRDKFAPIAQLIATATGRRVRTVLVPVVQRRPRGPQAKQEYDVAFLHPAHVPMAEIKAGRYRAVAWTQRLHRVHGVDADERQGAAEDDGGPQGPHRRHAGPGLDHGLMVRAMFRTEKITTSEAREPTPSTVRVITTRYQDAVPFYLENNFAQVGATASNAVVKSWTDKGGKVLLKSRPVPIKQIIVSTKMPAAEQQKIRDALRRPQGRKGGQRCSTPSGTRASCPPNPEVERLDIAWLGPVETDGHAPAAVL